MSNITSETLCAKLDEIADAIAARNWKGLPMSIPAQPNHDADLLVSEASKRIANLERQVKIYEDNAEEWRKLYEKTKQQLAETQKDAERYRALFVVPRSIKMPLLLPNHPNNLPIVEVCYAGKAGADADIDAAIDRAEKTK